MKKNWVVLFYLGLTLAAIIGMTLAGCSGGGGPIKTGGTPETPPSVSAAFTALLPASQAGATYVGNAQCATCHSTEATNVSHTKHALNNVSCENCHGPGSAHVANPGPDPVASPNPATTNAILTFPNISNAVVCAQCHGPIHTDWEASKHAEVVVDVTGSDPPGTVPQKAPSATCMRCHSAELRDQLIETPLAQGASPAAIDTGITTQTSAQLIAFATNTHASATCVTCHNPHELTGNINADGEDVQLRRATSNMDTTGIGAGVTVANYTVYNQVCGTCHNSRGADATDSGLGRETARVNVHEGPEMNMLLGTAGAEGNSGGPTRRTSSHAEVPDQCIHCHMPNASHTFTVKLDSSCVPCHTASDAAARDASVQGDTLAAMAALKTRLQNWAVSHGGGIDTWDYTANYTGETAPATIPIEVRRARHNYYFILLDRSFGVHNAFYTQFLLSYANAGLDNLGVAPVAPSVAPGARVSQQAVAQMKANIAPDVIKAKANGRVNDELGL